MDLRISSLLFPLLLLYPFGFLEFPGVRPVSPPPRLTRAAFSCPLLPSFVLSTLALYGCLFNEGGYHFFLPSYLRSPTCRLDSRNFRFPFLLPFPLFFSTSSMTDVFPIKHFPQTSFPSNSECSRTSHRSEMLSNNEPSSCLHTLSLFWLTFSD